MARTNRIVVKLNPIPIDSDVTIEQVVEEICGRLPQGELVRGPSRTGRIVFTVDPAANVASLAAELTEHNYVAYAEPDVVDREA